MTPIEKPIGTTFLLVKPSGKILLYQRDDGNGRQIKFPNAWCIPGETIEPDESPLDAVLRGSPEEFDIPLRPEQCHELCRYVHGDALDVVFVCKVPEETEGVLNEGQALQWMEFEEVKQLTLGWDQQIILQHIEEYLNTQKS